jgi:hypothetical protein
VILDPVLAEADAAYRQIYEYHGPLLRFLADLGAPLPGAIQTATHYILNTDLRRAFEREEIDLDRIGALLDQAHTSGVSLDTAGLSYALGQTIDRLAEELQTRADNLPRLVQLDALVGLARSLPFEVNLWKAQNVYYDILQTTYPFLHRRAGYQDPDAEAWVARFRALGDQLKVQLD